MLSVSVIFVCKDCRKKFSKMEEFIGHKKLKHPKEFQHVKCIAFEERPFGPEHRIRMQEEEDDENENEKDGNESVVSCAETISLSSDDSDDDLIELIDPNNVPDPTFDLNSILNNSIDGEHGSSNNGPSNVPNVDLLKIGINSYNIDRSQSYEQNYVQKTSLGRDPFFINHQQVEVESHHLDHAYYRSSLESNRHSQNEQNSPLSAANFPSHNLIAANNRLTIYKNHKKRFNNTIPDTNTGDLHTPTIPPQQNHLITDNTNCFNFGIKSDYYDKFTPSMEHHVPLKTNSASSISSTVNIDDVAGPEADAYSLFTSLIQSNSSPHDDDPDCMSGASSPLPCFYDDIEIDQDETDADDQTSSASASVSARPDVDVVKDFDPYGITFNIRSDNNENKNKLLYGPIRDWVGGRVISQEDESTNNNLVLNLTELNVDPVPVQVARASHGSGSGPDSVPCINLVGYCMIESDVGDEGDDKSTVTAQNINNSNDKKILENSGKPPFICEVCSMQFPSLSLKEIHQKYRFHFQQQGVSADGNSTYYVKPKRSQINTFYEKLNKIRKIL